MGAGTKLTQERLKELLDYDPVTGVFVWKSDRPRVRRGDAAGGPDAWGYIKIGVDGDLLPAHRLAWLWVYGELPTQRLKHRNGIGSDNRIANLYLVEKRSPGEPKKDPTAARVREIFDYDPISGELIWKVATSSKNPVGSIAGTIAGTGYRLVTVDSARFLAHRIVWLWNYGVMPPGDIDHINRDKSDNRIENLRIATRPQNNSNSKRRRDNSSGYTGVTWHAQSGKWRALIHVNKKQKHLGLFSTPEEAYAAYCVAAKAVFGEFAKT
jgi:hypothetical protein